MKLLVIAIFVAACAGGSHTATIPTWFAVPPDVGTLVVNDTEFKKFAKPLREAIEAQLAKTPDDKDRRFVLAMLDALDARWTESIAELDRIRAVETDARKKVMTGLSIRLWVSARAHGGENPAAFRTALENALVDLPIDLVRDDLAMLRAMGRAFLTVDVCRRLVSEAVHPDHDTISFEDTQAVVFQRYAAVHLVPVGHVIDEVLEAHGIQLPRE